MAIAVEIGWFFFVIGTIFFLSSLQLADECDCREKHIGLVTGTSIFIAGSIILTILARNDIIRTTERRLYILFFLILSSIVLVVDGMYLGYKYEKSGSNTTDINTYIKIICIPIASILLGVCISKITFDPATSIIIIRR